MKERSCPENLSDKIFDKLYKNFIEEIDAIDNGIPHCDGEPKYEITTNLSSEVSRLNPTWNEETSPEIEDARFELAMELVGTKFLERASYYATVWWPAREIVERAINRTVLSCKLFYKVAVNCEYRLQSQNVLIC
jgi:uncharacterized UPF0160 family protein